MYPTQKILFIADTLVLLAAFYRDNELTSQDEKIILDTDNLPVLMKGLK